MSTHMFRSHTNALLQRYAGHDGLFIDEALVTIRRPGQGVSLHSGGHKRRVRTQCESAFTASCAPESDH